MSAPKNIKVFGARAKLQTAPGTPIAVTNADAVLLAEAAVLKRAYAHDGKRKAQANGTMGNLRNVAPSGRAFETELKFEVRGAGSAYSASNLPNIHVLLRAAGLDAVVTTTGGVEKVVYTRTPGPTGFGIMSADLFGRGEQFTCTETYGDWTLTIDDAGAPILSVPVKGLLPTIADVAVPALVYGSAATVMPPKAINVGFTFNGIAGLKLHKAEIKLGRTINPRKDLNAAGHGGFSIGSCAPMLEFTVENAARATVDWDALRDAGAEYAWNIGAIGSVQYNRHKLFGAAAQILNVDDDADDPTALVKVSCQLNPSALGLNDEFSWQFD